jgi:hypothetical protein
MTQKKPKKPQPKWWSITATAQTIASAIADATGEEENLDQMTVSFIADFIANRFDFTDEEHEEFVSWATVNYEED